VIPGTTNEPERIEPWETLSYLTQGNPLLILTSLRQNPVQNKTNLTKRIEKEIDPSTVAEIVNEQQNQGLIRDRPSPAKNQYETTLFGNLVLEAYSNLLSEVGWKAIKYVAKSQATLTILKHLDGNLSTLTDLTEDGSICASRSTISNHLSNLEDLGWVNRKPPYECSPAGSTILDAYSEYANHIERLAERQPFLRHFDMPDLPLEAIPGTEMTAASVGDSDAPTQAFVDTIEEDFDHVRGATPTINKQYVREFRPLLGSDCRVELIGDRSVLSEANTTYVSAFAKGLITPTTTLLVSDEPITIGIAIFDHETVWLGAYGKSRRDRAVLTGSNDTLFKWASDAYEEICENATPSSKVITESVADMLKS
jgi:predicted transcriptional regulator